MPTILCVDDDFPQLTLLEFAFSRAGFSVICANDGQEAIKKNLSAHPDIILMDLMMPVKDGAKATAEIKAISALADVPIVLYTAYDRENLAQQALDNGAVEVIKKAIPPTQLVKKINQILAG